ncbi:placenta-specific protein 9-like [Carcharodon carcharias]|uniref:placenta-specific protein 9-like n=1 Tax=Carcharodon carcharias TaxID=13397 RepID=UPI001B7DFFC2|nr:placenta-specific protein 9-like [Carcharodon carcharias]
MRGVWAVSGILLLLGLAATEADPQRDDTDWCERDKALHKRLDIVEKNIEQTVNHLEAEISALLRFIEASNPPLQLGAPTMDIFENGLH